MKDKKLTLDEAIKIAKAECKNEYAQTYLNTIPEAIEYMGRDALRVQLLYVLSNMGTWRGERAREAKKILKEYASELPIN